MEPPLSKTSFIYSSLRGLVFCQKYLNWSFIFGAVRISEDNPQKNRGNIGIGLTVEKKLEGDNEIILTLDAWSSRRTLCSEISNGFSSLKWVDKKWGERKIKILRLWRREWSWKYFEVNEDFWIQLTVHLSFWSSRLRQYYNVCVSCWPDKVYIEGCQLSWPFDSRKVLDTIEASLFGST